VDPNDAPEATIDRFSEDAGTLMVRNDENNLPGPGDPIDFDEGPFITQGLSPDGDPVRYYNFDVQPTAAAPIYALFYEGEDEPIAGQLNLVGVIPGDSGYNDFWQVHKVTVPSDYEANTVTSVSEIMEAEYEIEPTGSVVNCPVVPEGSTATQRMGGGSTGLTRGWYQGEVIYYFGFLEKSIMVDAPDNDPATVPVSPIYVSFNANPDEDDPMSGPPSGFVTESGSDQTHNVVATLPDDDGYSPLWFVNVYDNADFANVSDLDSAESANILATGVATVNCPVVEVE
jgi:hypothetical protein